MDSLIYKSMDPWILWQLTLALGMTLLALTLVQLALSLAQARDQLTLPLF